MKLKTSPASGIGKLTFLIFCSIASVVGYAAYHIIPFYYYYYELVNQMEAELRTADVYKDLEIRERLVGKIKWMNIPVEDEDLKIDRSDRYMRIKLEYTEIFYVEWEDKTYDIWKFPFVAKAEGIIPGK